MPTDAARYAGCLVGQAVGDAVGFMVEGLSGSNCASYVEHSVRTRHIQSHPDHSYRFGQYTDDTQLARELALSIVERGGFEPADYARRLAEIFSEARVVGRGLATDAASRRLAAGVPWHDAGEPPPAAGNGSAMRAAPIGLLFAGDPQALREAAHDQGRMTHADPRCSAGAIAVAGATAIAVQRGRLLADEVAVPLAAWTRDLDPVLAHGIGCLPEWLGLHPDKVYERLHALTRDPAHEPPAGWRGITPFVTSTVLWSLYAALRSPEDYWEVICTAVSVGGDVDTMAAMAGAISGAAVGLGGIPREIAAQVHDQGEWRADALAGLARDLLEVRRARSLA